MVFVGANVTSLMMDAIDLSTAKVYLMHIDDSTALRPGGRCLTTVGYVLLSLYDFLHPILHPARLVHSDSNIINRREICRHIKDKWVHVLFKYRVIEGLISYHEKTQLYLWLRRCSQIRKCLYF